MHQVCNRKSWGLSNLGLYSHGSTLDYFKDQIQQKSKLHGDEGQWRQNKKILQKQAYKSKPICVASKLLNHNLEAQKFLSVQVLDISCADSGDKLLIL